MSHRKGPWAMSLGSEYSGVSSMQIAAEWRLELASIYSVRSKADGEMAVLIHEIGLENGDV